MNKQKTCDQCGNEYKNCFEVRTGSEIYFFDCFECAINHCAPRCTHCKCTIIGHGVNAENKIFCCDHCARNHDTVPQHRTFEAQHLT